MTQPAVGPLCLRCRHIRKDYTCAAFPDGIPPIIAFEGHDHTTPLPGDRGIVFQPMEGEAPDFDDLLDDAEL